MRAPQSDGGFKLIRVCARSLGAGEYAARAGLWDPAARSALAAPPARVARRRRCRARGTRMRDMERSTQLAGGSGEEMPTCCLGGDERE